MKKILVNAYLNSNLGDDLFLEELFSRYPYTQFYLRSNRVYEKKFKKHKNVYILKNKVGNKIYNTFLKLSKKILKSNEKVKMKDIKINYGNYDGYINIGGSIFIDKDGEHFKRNTSIYNEFLKRSKPVFILSCNFETNFKKELYDSYKNYFNQIKDKTKFDICFRDSYSYNLFKECQVVRMAPDIIFGFKKFDTSKKKKLGISPIDLTNRNLFEDTKEEYYKKIAFEANSFLNENINNEVVFFSFCKKEGDLKAIKNIQSRLENQNRTKVLNYKNNINKFINEFSECEKIIATRFHAMILSLIMDKKTYPFIYSEKMKNVIKDIKFGDEFYDIVSKNDNYIDGIDNDIHNLILKQTKNNSELQFLKLDKYLINEDQNE